MVLRLVIATGEMHTKHMDGYYNVCLLWRKTSHLLLVMCLNVHQYVPVSMKTLKFDFWPDIWSFDLY